MFEINPSDWFVAGLLLMALELVVPVFFCFWIGLSALAVGAMLFFIPMSLPSQLLAWAVLSIVTVVIWLKIWKPNRKKVADLTAENQIGMLIKTPSSQQLGRIRFQEPVQGSDEWPCRCEGDIAEGDRVRVVSVDDEVFVVARL